MSHPRSFATRVLVSLFLLGPSLATAQGVNGSIQATRTSGVAPLAVHFDATGTSHADSSVNRFHELTYDWDFGDPQAGSWAAGTQGSRNRDCCAPVAAHVFDRPGTYRVTLTITDAAGNQGVAVKDITVASADAHWSGGKTVCVANAQPTAGAGGCPSGATTVRSSDFDRALEDHLASNRRILFRCGDNFAADAPTTITDPGPGLVGSYGSTSGCQATVNISPQIGGNLFNTASNDWRIMDLIAQGPSNGTCDYCNFWHDSGGRNVLVYRNDPSNTGLAIHTRNQGFGVGAHQVFVVSNDIGPTVAQATGQNCVMFCGTKSALMGNKVHGCEDSPSSGADGHGVRVQCSDRVVFAHNDVFDVDGQTVAFRGPGPAGATHTCPDNNRSCQVPAGDCTNHVSIAGNHLVGSADAINNLLQIQPSSGSFDHCIHDVIVERNWFDCGPRGTNCLSGMRIAARDVTVRNNLFDASEMSGSFTAVSFEKNDDDSPRWDLEGGRVYGNTVYSGKRGSQSLTGVRLKKQHPTDSIRLEMIANNIVFAPDLSGAVAASLDAGTSAQHLGGNCDDTAASPCRLNGSAVGDLFVSSLPLSPLDFRVNASAGVCGAGMSVPVNLLDFGLNGRLSDTDTGAWGCGQPAVSPPAAPVLLP